MIIKTNITSGNRSLYSCLKKGSENPLTVKTGVARSNFSLGLAPHRSHHTGQRGPVPGHATSYRLLEDCCSVFNIGRVILLSESTEAPLAVWKHAIRRILPHSSTPGGDASVAVHSQTVRKCISFPAPRSSYRWSYNDLQTNHDQWEISRVLGAKPKYSVEQPAAISLFIART